MEATSASSAPDPRFWDREALAYSKKPIADEDAYQKTLERVRHHLRPEALALELGCGTGTTALHLAPHTAHILATDLSNEMIAIARAKARGDGATNVTFRSGTIDSDDLEANTFDVVMAFNFLHLLPDVPAALARAHALLKPGGLLITKTPCLGERNPLIGLVIRLLQTIGRAPFVNFLTCETLSTAVNGAGFETLETGMYPVKSKSLFLVAQKVD